MIELGAGTQVTPSIRLKRRLGAGGMGAVWIADHETLRTEVVVKFLVDRLAEDPTSQARFSQEAAAAAQVKSPHVVQMLDHGVMADGQPFIVMELLEGRDLSRELKQRSLGVQEVAHIVEHVALALHRAHKKGIVHRDIKPSNIFLCDVGANLPFIKLLDFGIARSGDQHLTATGSVVGTPAFMSPEQLSGKEVSAESDLWSLAMVAFKALTGITPFQRPTMQETMGAVMYAELPLPSKYNPQIDKNVDAWFAQACSRDPKRRFSSGPELAEALWTALGLERQIASSPTASPGPILPAAAVTVPITAPEPFSEGTLRSTVESQTLRPSLPPSRRTLWIGVAVAVGLVVLAAGAFGLGSFAGTTNSRLSRALARVALVARQAVVEPPPKQVASTKPAPEPEAPPPRPKAAPRRTLPNAPPKQAASAEDDDGLGF